MFSGKKLMTVEVQTLTGDDAVVYQTCAVDEAPDAEQKMNYRSLTPMRVFEQYGMFCVVFFPLEGHLSCHKYPLNTIEWVNETWHNWRDNVERKEKQEQTKFDAGQEDGEIHE